MSLCDHVVDVTVHQQERAIELGLTARTVLQHMRTTFPHDVEWSMFQKWWNGKVLVGAQKNIATFVPETGCLLIGIPKDGGRIEQLNTRLLLAMSTGSSNGRPCTRLHDSILKEASTNLGIRFELSCADIFEYGLNDTWGKGVACHRSRLSWPEVIGLPVQQVVEAFKKAGHPVDVATWDTMYGKPPSPGVIRIIYDARTSRVVSPAPHIGSLSVPEKDDQCFLKADKESSVSCIGAPLKYPPAEWGKFVGKFFTEVVDSLRVQYPHATIEALPSTTAISTDRRRDRIRVRFDPITARVTSIPTIG